MASIYLILQSKKNPAAIYVRLRDGRTIDVKAKTNFHINPLDWDEKLQRPTKKALKDIDVANLDTDLSTLTTDILKTYNLSKGKKLIDSQWLRDIINPPVAKLDFPSNLVGYIDTYLDFKKNEIKKSTVSKCHVIKSLILRYQKKTKAVILIKDIDSKFKLDFENYCEKEGYASNTTARNIRFIKTICRHAKANGIETHYQLDNIKAKYFKVDSIYLDKNEIKTIESLEKDDLNDSIDNARDWLLISCYCGQRVSDFLRFDKSMISYRKNKEGVLKPLIEFTQVKTDKLMTIPLDSKIIEIMKKYDGNFPRKISDQRYNDYIKIVCEKAKIDKPTKGIIFNKDLKTKVEDIYPKWKLVSSHIGRRSFATNNYGEIPTPFLMYITGHSTEQMFLTYIGKSNKDLALEITKYF
jgi:integrase